ncbi:MAG: hypothetical protein HXY38_07730 [Chloroflexi bacterium]|nr:hypothetical protein [Chloroflexota bacterium]
MRLKIFFTQPVNLFLISMMILSCTMPVSTADDIELYFGRPQAGDVIMVGETFSLLANGASSGGTVSRVLFFANGALVGEAPNVAGETIVAEYRWTPEEPGQYTLQFSAQRGSEYHYSETIQVCVLPFQIAPGHPTDIYAHGYEGDCVIPTPAASSTPGDPATDTVSASPDPLTYVPLYYESCPDQTRVVNFKFYINDPGNEVVFASINMQMDPAFFGRISGETTLALTQIASAPPNTKQYAGSLDMHIYFSRSLTVPETGEGLSGNLTWRARAYNRSGEIVLEEGPFTIEVNPTTCDGILPATLTPTIVSTSEAQLTATPASALDCPPGTYYSDITNKCYQIAIPTATKKESNDNNDSGGGGNVINCSQFDSSNACIAAGCSYNYATKTCESP